MQESKLIIRWYQEPWVWFIAILLLTAVTAALFMTWLAMRNTPAEIGSEWYQEGALAKREREQAAVVQQINLHGELTITTEGKLQLTLQQDKAPTAEQAKLVDATELILFLEHPVNPQLDQKITLKRTAHYLYTGQINQKAMHGRYNLLIRPDKDKWYISGKGYFPTTGVKLTPDMS
jgi:hypothetical protein